MGTQCSHLAVCSAPQHRHNLIFGEDSGEVVLNIYDIGESREVRHLNRFLQQFGTGAFHCGVEIFGLEWSYSDLEEEAESKSATAGATGVFNCWPRQCEGHAYCCSVQIGRSFVQDEHCESLLSLLREQWIAYNYDALHHNCCHFCQEFCIRLGVGTIPLWVRSLATAGEAVENRAGEVLDCRCCAMITDGVQDSLCWQLESSGGEESIPIKRDVEEEVIPVVVEVDDASKTTPWTRTS